MNKNQQDEQIFTTEKWVDFFSNIIYNNQEFWLKLGNFESKVLADELKKVKVNKPIYITGLARSGSTLLLEIMYSHQKLISHQYKDFPFIYTPFWWQWLLKWIENKNVKPTERAHKDRILITPDSPEAMEEILWSTFFPNAHNPEISNILDQVTTNVKFEKFYKNHLKKLLLAKNGMRYLAKGNYNFTRLEYILKIFPEAKFIIPIRHPVTHIASLMKQHLLFCQGEKQNPLALKHLQRVGHFEFGLDLRPINVNNTSKVQEVIELWNTSQDVKAWAIYWHEVYQYIAQTLNQNRALKEASIIIRYEDLCESPQSNLEKLMKHCELDNSQEIIEKFSSTIKPPSYYKPDFSEEELTIIEKETSQTSLLFGY